MIESIALYLGLVPGPQNLGVSVGPDVAAVEIIVDGDLERPPLRWLGEPLPKDRACQTP